MVTAEEYDTPEDVVVDIADLFDEHADDLNEDVSDYHDTVTLYTEIGGICRQHDIDGDTSVQAILDGFDYYVERQKMQTKSDLRETLEAMDFLWRTPGGER